jgi:hypothetical protein
MINGVIGMYWLVDYTAHFMCTVRRRCNVFPPRNQLALHMINGVIGTYWLVDYTAYFVCTVGRYYNVFPLYLNCR